MTLPTTIAASKKTFPIAAAYINVLSIASNSSRLHTDP